MIDQNDIEFMAAARAEMYAGRTRKITMTSRTETGKDPYTKQPIFTEVNHVIMAVVTEIQGEPERSLSNGVVINDGDIQFSVSIDQIVFPKGDYINVYYEGVKHTILSADKKGIGDRNRIEFIGRVTK